jgi:hypothetical protein
MPSIDFSLFLLLQHFFYEEMKENFISFSNINNNKKFTYKQLMNAVLCCAVVVAAGMC